MTAPLSVSNILYNAVCQEFPEQETRNEIAEHGFLNGGDGLIFYDDIRPFFLKYHLEIWQLMDDYDKDSFTPLFVKSRSLDDFMSHLVWFTVEAICQMESEGVFTQPSEETPPIV